jgi:regulator of replication initiation timing
MDLNQVLKNLEQQLQDKGKEIQQLEQALNKAVTDGNRLQGAYALAKSLMEDDKPNQEASLTKPEPAATEVVETL